MATDRQTAEDWQRELSLLARALSGAFLFGMPLLFTMEMWWLGERAPSGLLLLILAISFGANLLLVQVAGFKHEHHHSFGETIQEAIEALAIGAVASIVVLVVLDQIALSDPPRAIVGKVVVQMLPLSLGASIAGAVFAGEKGREGNGLAMPSHGVLRSLSNDVGATAIGAAFIGSTIGPTDEVPLLAASLDYWHLLALIALTLVLGYFIVFVSGFDPRSSSPNQGPFNHPITETTLAYAVALFIAFGIISVVQHFGSETPPPVILQQTLVLGLPAMIGGAAGRIVA